MEKGAKSQAVVDAIREEMRSCLCERGLLDERNCLLPNKQAQDATTQTDFIHLLDYDKGSEGIRITLDIACSIIFFEYAAISQLR